MLNRDDYIAEALRQLSDTTFYKALNFNPSKEYTEELKQLIKHYLSEGALSKQEAD